MQVHQSSGVSNNVLSRINKRSCKPSGVLHVITTTSPLPLPVLSPFPSSTLPSPASLSLCGPAVNANWRSASSSVFGGIAGAVSKFSSTTGPRDGVYDSCWRHGVDDRGLARTSWTQHNGHISYVMWPRDLLTDSVFHSVTFILHKVTTGKLRYDVTS